MFQTKVLEKIRRHILCLIYFPSQNRELMWKNIVQPGKPQLTAWRLRIAHWIPKATKTHSEYIILHFH